MSSGCGGTGCCWQRPHVFGERDHTQTYSFPLFVSGVRLRERGLYYVEQRTQNASVVFCIFRIPSRIRDLINGLWQTASCPHPTTYMLCVLGYSHLQLFHESRVTMFLEIFQRITSQRTKNLHLCGQWFLFSPKAFSSERLVNPPTFISPWRMQKNICVK